MLSLCSQDRQARTCVLRKTIHPYPCLRFGPGTAYILYHTFVQAWTRALSISIYATNTISDLECAYTRPSICHPTSHDTPAPIFLFPDHADPRRHRGHVRVGSGVGRELYVDGDNNLSIGEQVRAMQTTRGPRATGHSPLHPIPVPFSFIPTSSERAPWLDLYYVMFGSACGCWGVGRSDTVLLYPRRIISGTRRESGFYTPRLYRIGGGSSITAACTPMGTMDLVSSEPDCTKGDSGLKLVNWSCDEFTRDTYYRYAPLIEIVHVPSDVAVVFRDLCAQARDRWREDYEDRTVVTRNRNDGPILTLLPGKGLTTEFDWSVYLDEYWSIANCKEHTDYSHVVTFTRYRSTCPLNSTRPNRTTRSLELLMLPFTDSCHAQCAIGCQSYQSAIKSLVARDLKDSKERGRAIALDQLANDSNNPDTRHAQPPSCECVAGLRTGRCQDGGWLLVVVGEEEETARFVMWAQVSRGKVN
ncbi:hypothetical protein AG1IA_00778 [Rhizoctonia solani AG-1 IA]|uniref:Uncharacterized protein n=1 Tax=Thanatephorus cucumeris (strain AG1-IA) TaxID=983506 RepID=L8X7Y7_THACA|nr:hypothetical protein AG1IA_00778 [Rhizoctonia solani AG-1 IA]